MRYAFYNSYSTNAKNIFYLNFDSLELHINKQQEGKCQNKLKLNMNWTFCEQIKPNIQLIKELYDQVLEKILRAIIIAPIWSILHYAYADSVVISRARAAAQ